MKPTIVINIQTIEQGFTVVKILELFELHFVIIGILGFHLRAYLFFSKTFPRESRLWYLVRCYLKSPIP